MSFRSNRYKDREKWRIVSNRWKKRYRDRTGSGQYGNRRWEKWEIEAILLHKVSDRELSKQLMRSVTAIQIKRTRELKRSIDKEEEK